MEGNQRQSQTNRKRSVLFRCARFDARRRSTLICSRRTRISASSFALDLKERSQDAENQLEQIGHQVASLSRLSPPSMPNLIFGTHTRREVAATPGLPQLIFMGIAPKKSRLPMSTPQWRRIA